VGAGSSRDSKKRLPKGVEEQPGAGFHLPNAARNATERGVKNTAGGVRGQATIHGGRFRFPLLHQPAWRVGAKAVWQRHGRNFFGAAQGVMGIINQAERRIPAGERWKKFALEGAGTTIL